MPVGILARRDQVLIAASLVLITGLARVDLIYLDHRMSSDMEHDKMMAAMGMTMYMPWTAADVFFTFAMWAVMMVDMMAPAAAPVLLLFAAARAERGERTAPLAALIFGLGYVAVWAGFSVGAALAQWTLHQAAMLSVAMTVSSPRLAGAILIAAGVYQLTPWKGKCLTHCRGPLGFPITNWRGGKLDAFQMGFHQGVYCLSCCWALMCVLLVGVMNLVWVAALTGFVLLAKAGPARAVIARVVGATIVMLGIVAIA